MAITGILLAALLLVLVFHPGTHARLLDSNVTGYEPDDLKSSESLERLFDLWAARFQKNYLNDSQRRERFEIFRDNIHYIDARNQQIDFVLGLNELSDLTSGEHQRYFTGYIAPKNKSGNTFSSQPSVNKTAFTWRNKGVLTRVKNQGSCGSCWAFSTTGAVEGLHAIKVGKRVMLSEQELIDCVSDCSGCNGGNMEYAFNFISRNGGIASASDYTYSASNGNCNSGKKQNHVASITGYENVARKENALLAAVAKQPVSVAIDGGGRDFQSYASGVFTGNCDTDLDHAMLVVGWGTSAGGIDYWALKNSWGTSWGDSGYMRIKRVGGSDGLCGMYKDASFPTM